MKTVIIRGFLATVCFMFIVSGSSAIAQNTNPQKPLQEHQSFRADKEAATLLYRTPIQEQELRSSNAIYIILEDGVENIEPDETDSPWIKKFWKEMKMLFKAVNA